MNLQWLVSYSSDCPAPAPVSAAGLVSLYLGSHSSVYLQTSQVVLVVKNPPADVGDIRDAGCIPGSGRPPGREHGNPLQYCCLKNTIDRGAWGLQSMGSQGVRHDWSNLAHSMYTHTHIYVCSLEKEGNLIILNIMDEPRRHHYKQNKPDREGNTV